MGGQASDYAVRAPDPASGIHRADRDGAKRDPQERHGHERPPDTPEPAQDVTVEVSAQYRQEHEAPAAAEPGSSAADTPAARTQLDIEA